MAQTEARPADRDVIRRRVAAALVLLTCLSVLASTVGVWARRTALDTDRFVALLAPVAERPAVRRGLAAYLTDRVFEAVDVEGGIRSALARAGLDAGRLARPLAEATRTRVRDGVEAFLGSDAFRRLWVGALTAGHRAASAVVRGELADLPGVTVREGEVRLNLLPLIAEALRRLGDRLGLDPGTPIPTIASRDRPDLARARLSSALGVSLPAGFGELTVMSEERLRAARSAVRTFERFVWWLVIISLVLTALALAISLARRRTLIQLGLGVAAALLVGAAYVRRVEDAVVEAAARADPDAVREVVGTAAASLVGLGRLVLWGALLVGAAAYLAGRPPWIGEAARWVSGRVTAGGAWGWVAAHGDGLRVAGLAAAVLILFLTGIGWPQVVLVGGCLVVALWTISYLERTEASEGRKGP